MHKQLKSIFGIILLVCFLLSATGLHFHKHICSHCNTEKVAVIVEPKCSCDTKDHATCKRINKKECTHPCHTQHLFFKIKDDYIYSSYNAFQKEWFSTAISPSQPLFSLLPNPEQVFNTDYDLPPNNTNKILDFTTVLRL